ncbi:UDP-N-acetylmuramoyl-L-alanyl-D-glutamate--2,6-diaminopimelate ligase [Nocardioides limicola]|uniref:UDP-N-acetylmuramoyl-L-alanyl-D-glutamate--2, 6-diaminopimelate ligase n=1 Tax=Nocardioides limicola TaxID=2803368 RepID=UPI0035573F7B
MAALVGDRVSGRDLGDVEVTGISLSSLRVCPGDLYAALPGARAHGIEYAPDAVAAGAVAILTDDAGAAAAPAGVPLLVTDDPRAVLGAVSATVYGQPATALRLVAVTGTQGKTTTTRLAESAWQSGGVPAAVIGTVGTRVAGRDLATVLTTPEAPDLHGLFARMREDGVTACAMEVSSHALVLGRVDGVVFDVAVFTNLGRDHLDFHRDLEDYYQAKAVLFTPERTRLGLVNIDDEHGRRLAAEATVPVRTYAVEAEDADWRAIDVRLGADGSTFTVLGPDGVRVAAAVPLAGAFNVSNALAAIAASAEAGLDPVLVAAGIATGPGVPGRLERVDVGQACIAIVDYAHKPDAVAAVLDTLRPLTGRLVVVLGAGGDRDPGKRTSMGAAAARSADLLVVTDDNPRSEDPSAIRAQIIAGAAGQCDVVEEGDRRLAIRRAVRGATAGDIVVVLGKGHETGQESGGVVRPFDDRVVLAEELRALEATP